MYEFNYSKPTSVEAAVEQIGKSEESKFLAGGQTLLPTMKHRLASPEEIVDLSAIGDLRGITIADHAISIGAMTTHAEVATADLVRKKIPALASLAGEIGDPAVRNRGTLGGSIANNDPAADYPAALLALGATVITNTREIAAEDFFLGMFETALAEDELVIRVVFPCPDKAAYCKFANPASRYAVVGVFVAMFAGQPHIAVTGATPCAHRALRMEAALAEKLSVDSIDAVELPVEKMNSDMHASAEYRAHLVKVMTKRALTSCL